MNAFLKKVQEKLIDRSVEGIAFIVSLIFIWFSTIIGSKIFPLIESSISPDELVKLLVASIILNIVLLIVLIATNRKDKLRLKYGIYWDREKNPHCPNCQIPIGNYGSYNYNTEKGYYCKPCGKVFPLVNATGMYVKPEDVLLEL